MNLYKLPILYFSFLILSSRCKDEIKSSTTQVDTIIVFKNLLLDRNHFNVIKNKSGNELIYIDEYGKKEISWVFDQNRLFKVNHFENQKIKRTNKFFHRGKDTLVLLKIFHHPNLKHEETFQEGFIIKPDYIYADNIKDPFFEHITFLSTKDTFERNDKASLKISIPELKEFNLTHLITEGVDDYFRVDTINFNLINITNQRQYLITLNTKSPGINYKRGIVYYSKINSDGSFTNTTRPFEFKYFVKSKDHLSNIDRGFSRAINKKIRNGT